MSDPAAQLKRALEAGDLEAARAAFQALESSVLALVDGQRQRHLGRLIDLGQAAAELAHELRQPLSAVKSFAQMITLTPELPEKIGDRAGLILTNAERMEAFVERVAEYSRGRSRAAVLEPCHLHDVIEAAVALLRLEKKPAITLTRDLAPDLPEIQADALGLQQIFINLLGNARQSLGDGPGNIRVVTRAGPDGVEAWVADDGPGVPPERRPRLFEPFVTHKDGGTGLGLSISRRIAEHHGGRLELVDQQPGATFYLSLPRSRGA